MSSHWVLVVERCCDSVLGDGEGVLLAWCMTTAATRVRSRLDLLTLVNCSKPVDRMYPFMEQGTCMHGGANGSDRATGYCHVACIISNVCSTQSRTSSYYHSFFTTLTCEGAVALGVEYCDLERSFPRNIATWWSGLDKSGIIMESLSVKVIADQKESRLMCVLYVQPGREVVILGENPHTAWFKCSTWIRN